MGLRLISEEQFRKIHDSVLKHLGELGIHVMDEAVRKRLLKEGCGESADERILFPEEVVAKSISSIPGKMVLYDRDGNVAVDSSGQVPRFSPGLNCINVLDYRTGEHRLCTLQDIRETARLCDRLPNIDMAASLGNPAELKPSEQAIETIRTIVAETTKPVAFIAHDEVEDEEIWNFLADIAGGWNALSDRPFALDLTGPYSPLELGEEACRRLKFASRHRIPVVCYPALITGATGPVTLAGALTQSSAEILAGLVVHQLENPGSPVITGSSILPMDLQTGCVTYGSPEYSLASLAAVDYFRYLGVPTWFGAGCTDAHVVDAQAAAEAGMNMQAAVFSSTAFIHNLGYLSAGKTGSLEMLVLADELAGRAKRFAAGFSTEEEYIAGDVTKRCYETRAFMMDDHTLKHMKTEIRESTMFPRISADSWKDGGKITVKDRIREKLQDILG